MNKQVAKVLNEYIALSASDKREFIQEINKYIKSSDATKILLNEEVRKAFDSVNFGPAPVGCPCCGK